MKLPDWVPREHLKQLLAGVNQEKRDQLWALAKQRMTHELQEYIEQNEINNTDIFWLYANETPLKLRDIFMIYTYVQPQERRRLCFISLLTKDARDFSVSQLNQWTDENRLIKITVEEFKDLL